MKPKRDSAYYNRKTEIVTQNNSSKQKEYVVTFENRPEKHKIIITLRDGWYNGEIKFTKELLNQDNIPSTGTSYTLKDLDELKTFVRNFLLSFGKYQIKAS